MEQLKILMLEDLEDDVGLIERALRKEGMDFLSRRVDTREEFTNALREFSPDVILSDHALPQFNSIEALKICKKNSIQVPFILVTGAVSEEFAVSCLKQGADDYVLKSNLVRLPSAIANSIRQRQMEQKRKKAEKALRRQNEELVKINKELDSFVYSVSHNLRAPLMSVLGLLNLARLDEGTRSNTILNHHFHLMETSIHKLDDTLKEILDYSRNARSSIKIEKVMIREAINDAFERLKYLEGTDTIDRHVNVEDMEPMYTDPYRVTVILSNLISNAIKYKDSNKERSFINIQVDITSNNMHLLFEDNGIGIAPDLMDRIFNMFFRATDRSDGAGLGLYIVKETVEKLGGSISVRSNLGEGTTFSLDIPNHVTLFERATDEGITM